MMTRSAPIRRKPHPFARLFLAATLTLCSALPAAADPAQAPDKTTDFLTYCRDATHRKICKARIVQVDIYQLATESCGYLSEGIDKYEALKSILYWLAEHPGTRNLPTDDGIRAAMKALWPCKL